MACKIGVSSEKCTECLSKNSTTCSLSPFSLAKWDRIRRQKVQKQKELRDTFAKVTRLQGEVAALEEKELTIVNNKVVNISDLKREEQANTLDLDSYLFDIPSE